MKRWLVSLCLLGALGICACGDMPTTARTLNLRVALTNDVEALQPGTLDSIYRELVLASQSDAQGPSSQLLTFLDVDREGNVAPLRKGLSRGTDLLQLGESAQAVVNLRDGDWSTDGNDSYGISTRAAELVAKGWMSYQGIDPTGPVNVVRVRAPYAVAFFEGDDERSLQLNGVFLAAVVRESSFRKTEIQ